MFERIAADMVKTGSASKALEKELTNLTTAGKELGHEIVDAGGDVEKTSQGFLAAAQSAEKMTFASKAATLGMKALKVAGNMALIAGVAFILSIPAKIAEAQEKARQAAVDSADAFNESTSSIDDYKAKITELQGVLASGNLTQGEAYDKRKELMSIQDEIIAKYGDEAKGIDLVNGTLENQIDLFDKITKSKANSELSKNSQANKDATNKIEGDSTYILSSRLTYKWFDSESGNPLKELLKAFEDTGIRVDQYGNGQFDIKLTADAKEAQQTQWEHNGEHNGDGSLVFLHQRQTQNVVECRGDLWSSARITTIIIIWNNH